MKEILIGPIKLDWTHKNDYSLFLLSYLNFRPVQNIQLDVHTMEPAIIVRYDVSNPRGIATKKEANNKQQKQTMCVQTRT